MDLASHTLEITAARLGPVYGAPDWTVNRGPYTYIKSNYQNITDNLLDPAHVSFVHDEL